MDGVTLTITYKRGDIQLGADVDLEKCLGEGGRVDDADFHSNVLKHVLVQLADSVDRKMGVPTRYDLAMAEVKALLDG